MIYLLLLVMILLAYRHWIYYQKTRQIIKNNTKNRKDTP